MTPFSSIFRKLKLCCKKLLNTFAVVILRPIRLLDRLDLEINQSKWILRRLEQVSKKWVPVIEVRLTYQLFLIFIFASIANSLLFLIVSLSSNETLAVVAMISSILPLLVVIGGLIYLSPGMTYLLEFPLTKIGLAMIASATLWVGRGETEIRLNSIFTIDGSQFPMALAVGTVLWSLKAIYSCMLFLGAAMSLINVFWMFLSDANIPSADKLLGTKETRHRIEAVLGCTLGVLVFGALAFSFLNSMNLDYYILSRVALKYDLNSFSRCVGLSEGDSVLFLGTDNSRALVVGPILGIKGNIFMGEELRKWPKPTVRGIAACNEISIRPRSATFTRQELDKAASSPDRPCPACADSMQQPRKAWLER
ncbi:hypothetical protein LMG27952_02638 [Paraburkholderia hiiakae]|uniref:Uncharacterized protein n=1 Tax=Paraburkholderia hiiakae TaxID=1081782 RepID=A0ABM8NLZ6_9BURK|nr:hypothetical protein [Paraburkholderia hiiakae]CAD6532602.1 hypothetical protein LMG27952_02638 [Paraburkholderia hiiakae]